MDKFSWKKSFKYGFYFMLFVGVFVGIYMNTSIPNDGSGQGGIIFIFSPLLPILFLIDNSKYLKMSPPDNYLVPLVIGLSLISYYLLGAILYWPVSYFKRFKNTNFALGRKNLFEISNNSKKIPSNFFSTSVSPIVKFGLILFLLIFIYMIFDLIILR